MTGWLLKTRTHLPSSGWNNVDNNLARVTTECMYVWMDGWLDAWMYVWTYGCTDGCMVGWIDGCMDGCMNIYVYIYIYMYICLVPKFQARHWDEDSSVNMFSSMKPPFGTRTNISGRLSKSPGDFPSFAGV